MPADHCREPRVGGFVDVIEHDASRTRGHQGQALRKIRLPDCPLQPVILVIRLAGHACSLTRICHWPSEKRWISEVRGDFDTEIRARVTTAACYTHGADCLKLLTIHEN